MTQFEKVGVLVITGLVAVILALALFGAESKPLDAEGWGEQAEAGAEASVESTSLDSGEGESSGTASASNGLAGAAPWYLLTDDSIPNREPSEAAPRGESFPRGGTTRKAMHTIRRGDNLFDLAERYLGDGTKYPRIVDANPGLHPQRLQLGMKIRIPDSASPSMSREDRLRQLARETESDPRKPKTQPAKKKSSETETYTVRKGDTLTRIAKRLLKDSNQWQTLYAMNRDQLSKPEALREGQKIRVPVVR